MSNKNKKQWDDSAISLATRRGTPVVEQVVQQPDADEKTNTPQDVTYKYKYNGQEYTLTGKQFDDRIDLIFAHARKLNLSNYGLRRLEDLVGAFKKAATVDASNTSWVAPELTFDSGRTLLSFGDNTYGSTGTLNYNRFGSVGPKTAERVGVRWLSQALLGTDKPKTSTTVSPSSFVQSQVAASPSSESDAGKEEFNILTWMLDNLYGRDPEFITATWNNLTDDEKLVALNEVAKAYNLNKTKYNNVGYNYSGEYDDLNKAQSDLYKLHGKGIRALFPNLYKGTSTQSSIFPEGKTEADLTEASRALSGLGITHYLDNGDGTITGYKKGANGTYTLASNVTPYRFGLINLPDSKIIADPEHYGYYIDNTSTPGLFIYTKDVKTLPSKIRNGMQLFQNDFGTFFTNRNGVFIPAEYSNFIDSSKNYVDLTNVFGDAPYQNIFVENPIHTDTGMFDIYSPQTVIVKDKSGAISKGTMVYDPENGFTYTLNETPLANIGAFISRNNYTSPIYDNPWFNEVANTKYNNNPFTSAGLFSSLKDALKSGDSNKIRKFAELLKASILHGDWDYNKYLLYKDLFDALDAWALKQKQSRQVAAHKYGGILKLQFGGLALKYREETGYEPEAYLAPEGSLGHMDNWYDKARAGALAGDALSLAGGVPGILGAIGSLGVNTVANWADPNVSRGDAWKEFAVNVGFLALSAIPGLAALKVAKGAGKVAKSTEDAIKVLGKINKANVAADKVKDIETTLSNFNKLNKAKSAGITAEKDLAKAVGVAESELAKITEQEAKNAAKELVELNNSLGGKLFGENTIKINNTLYSLMEAEDTSNKIKKLNNAWLGAGYVGSALAVGNAVPSVINTVNKALDGDWDEITTDDVRSIIYGIGGVKGFQNLRTNSKNFNKLRETIGSKQTKPVQAQSKNTVKLKDIDGVTVEVEGKPTAQSVKKALDVKINEIEGKINAGDAAGENTDVLYDQLDKLTKLKKDLTESNFKDKVDWSGVTQRVNEAKDNAKGAFNKVRDFVWNDNEFETDQFIPPLQQTRWIFPHWYPDVILYKRGGSVAKYEKGADASRSGENPEEDEIKKTTKSRIDKIKTEDEEGELTFTDLISRSGILPIDIEPLGTIFSGAANAMGNKAAWLNKKNYEVPYVIAPWVHLSPKLNLARENQVKEQGRLALNRYAHNLTSDLAQNNAAFLDTKYKVDELVRKTDAEAAADLNQQKNQAIQQEYINRSKRVDAENTNRAHAVAKSNAINELNAAYQKSIFANIGQGITDIWSWLGRRIDQFNDANYNQKVYDISQKYVDALTDAQTHWNHALDYDTSYTKNAFAPNQNITASTVITADMIKGVEGQQIFPGFTFDMAVGKTPNQIYQLEKSSAEHNYNRVANQKQTELIGALTDKTRYAHMLQIDPYRAPIFKDGGSVTTAEARKYSVDRMMKYRYDRLMAEINKHYSNIADRQYRAAMAGSLRAFLQLDKHAFSK